VGIIVPMLVKIIRIHSLSNCAKSCGKGLDS